MHDSFRMEEGHPFEQAFHDQKREITVNSFPFLKIVC